MKQEHRFVAELYRYLSPFVDSNEDIYLSLDGEAAKKGVSQKYFEDADVPDLWFTLIGHSSETLIEAKSLYSANSIKLGQGQLTAWKTGGAGKHKPSAWIAVAEGKELKPMYYWRHDAFLSKLDTCQSTQDYPEIRLPDDKLVFDDIRVLALHILRTA